MTFFTDEIQKVNVGFIGHPIEPIDGQLRHPRKELMTKLKGYRLGLWKMPTSELIRARNSHQKAGGVFQIFSQKL